MAGGVNTYTYFENNPINLTDPTGNCPWCIAWAAYEIGSSLYDIYNAAQAISNSCAGNAEKYAAVGGAMLGILAPDGGYGTAGKHVAKGMAEIPWSSKSVRDAAKPLEQGATEIGVDSRSQAEELFLGRYQGQGDRNTTGMSPTEAKDFFGGKSGFFIGMKERITFLMELIIFKSIHLKAMYCVSAFYDYDDKHCLELVALRATTRGIDSSL